MNKKIIILSGDPNSINSEIIFKSWKKLTKSIRKKLYLFQIIAYFKNSLKN